MGDQETYDLMGAGRLFFGIGGDAVTLASGPITVSSKNPLIDTSDGGQEEPLFPTKPICIEGRGSVMGGTDLAPLFDDGAKVRVLANPSDRSLPRRMKKANRRGSAYRRDTRWKRKAARWLERNTVDFTGRLHSEGDGSFTISGSDGDM